MLVYYILINATVKKIPKTSLKYHLLTHFKCLRKVKIFIRKLQHYIFADQCLVLVTADVSLHSSFHLPDKYIISNTHSHVFQSLFSKTVERNTAPLVHVSNDMFLVNLISPHLELQLLETRKKFNPCCLLSPPPPPLFPPPPSQWRQSPLVSPDQAPGFHV